MNGRLQLIMASLIVISACTKDVGVRVEEFKPAHTPAGASTEVVFERGIIKGNKLHGELLAVNDKGILLLLMQPLDTAAGRRRFIEAPFVILRSIDVEQLGSARVKSEGGAMDDERLGRLRRLCRFPQGLSEELKAQLLATYGESDIHVPQKKSGD